MSIGALQVARAEFPPDPSSVPQVRELVGTVTEHLPHRAREAAGLVASELATNSVVHARTDFEVFAAADDIAVEVVVADRTGWVTATPDELSSGNGLLLVGLLSSEWAAEIEGAGKRVWARLLVDDLPLC
jgi:anti-sigma regulatory factor (Ser/Thr protein kinase)